MPPWPLALLLPEFTPSDPLASHVVSSEYLTRSSDPDLELTNASDLDAQPELSLARGTLDDGGGTDV